MELSEDIIEAARLKSKGREMRQIDIEDDGEEFPLIVMMPTRTEWGKFLSEMNDEDINRKLIARENVVLALAVYPERALIQKFFERKISCVVDVSNELAKFMGADAKVRSKKL